MQPFGNGSKVVGIIRRVIKWRRVRAVRIGVGVYWRQNWLSLKVQGQAAGEYATDYQPPDGFGGFHNFAFVCFVFHPSILRGLEPPF